MTYQVNAWLERDEPQLQVTDKRSGRVLIDWDAPKVRQLVEEGVICVADLLGSEAELQETVRDLLLRDATNRLGQGLQR